MERGGRAIIDKAALALEAGQLIAVVGPNGAGKSTLLRGMVGIWEVSEGAVEINGVDLRTLSPTEIATRVAFVPQHHSARYAFSVRELVALGQYARKRSGHVADLGKELDDAIRWADVDSIADRPANEISGGEAARVYLARAHVAQTPWMVLDEPAAHLDIAHQLDLMAKLRSLADHGKGVVVAMHDLPMAANWADEILLLHHGSIRAQGPPEDVLSKTMLRNVFHVDAELSQTNGQFSLTFRKPAGEAREKGPPPQKR